LLPEDEKMRDPGKEAAVRGSLRYQVLTLGADWLRCT